MITKQHRQHLIKILTTSIPQVIAIYLFGSEAHRTANQTSDVDLAVLASSKLSPQLLWQISNKISRAIMRDVDLVDLRFASTVFQTQVINNGIRIYVKSNFEADLFELHILSDYIALNELRSDLIKDVQQRGSIYGE